ncbi:MAG TPA: hypothetical protein VE596_11310 [Gaiellaceae bacterium]|jgi:hypothetical protein|nr:hypothetical protein [Gaiellaceae bacterium]
MHATETKRTLYRKRELVRLAFAAADFRAALWITRNALSDPAETPTGSDIHFALWTAAVVCYARPFSASNRVGGLSARYARGFPEERLKGMHETLLRERKRSVAHTDEVELANVAWVFPPSTERPKGGIGVARAPFLREAITDAADLCLFQKNRMIDRAEEVIVELYGVAQSERPIRLTYPTDEEIAAAPP